MKNRMIQPFSFKIPGGFRVLGIRIRIRIPDIFKKKREKAVTKN